MRKEYDLSKGERGKFYGQVDTKNPIIEKDVETLDEIFEDELDISTREKIAERISNASEILDEIALSK